LDLLAKRYRRTWRSELLIRVFVEVDEEASKDCERLVQTSECFIEVAMIRLMLKRLAKGV
jgi:hypothetical protein